MDARHWALIAAASIVVGACGPTHATAAPTPKPKPSAAPTVAAAPTLLVMPFEDVWFLNPTEGWALVLSEADHAVEAIHSVDGGATWSAPVNVTSLFVAEGDAPAHYGIRFITSQVGWVFGNGIYATTDGGQTWKDTATPENVSDLATFGNSAWAITGCDPRVTTRCPSSMLLWDSLAKRWTSLPNQPPMTSGPQHLIRTSNTRAFIVQETVGRSALLRTDDGGINWVTLAIPCQGFGLPTATLDGEHVWMVCPSSPGAGQQGKDVYTSADSGTTWTLRARTDPPDHYLGTITSSGYAQELALATATTGFLSMNRGDLYRTTDGGATWLAAGISHGEGYFPALDFVDASHGWAVAQVSSPEMDGRVGLYRTTDGGTSWSLASSMPGSV
jgi:photosystem II stability/assembly factor-like uncharacterized protein